MPRLPFDDPPVSPYGGGSIPSPMGRSDGLDNQAIGEVGDVLSVLASPTRLQILQSLRIPKRPSDVRVQAHGGPSDLPEDRMISRPAVVKHLRVLEAHDLVRKDEGTGTYVVNQQMLFALLREVGQLARIRPVIEVDVEKTRKTPGLDERDLPTGPRFLLVAGPREGDAFPLDGPGPWTIGRGTGSDVCLDFDPHVSRVHAHLSRKDGRYLLEAEAESKNPVLVDFRPAARGQRIEVPEGSVLGLGLSRLVLQTRTSDG